MFLKQIQIISKLFLNLYLYVILNCKRLLDNSSTYVYGIVLDNWVYAFETAVKNIYVFNRPVSCSISCLNCNMKTLTSKQIARQKKKKEKMEALVAISKLNNGDLLAHTNEVKEVADDCIDYLAPSKKCKKEEEEIIKNDKGRQSEQKTADEQLKQEYKEVKMKRKSLPRFRLKVSGDNASLDTHPDERVPLFLTDIQHLLLYSMLGDSAPYHPSRWCQVDRFNSIHSTVTLIIEGLSLYHLISYELAFKNLNKIFPNKLEIITPALYEGSLVQELASVPLNKDEKESLVKKYGSLDVAMECRKDLMFIMKAVFPVEDSDIEDTSEHHVDDKFPRTRLVLSAWQLIEENYPVPLKGKLQQAYADYVMSKGVYTPVTPSSPMFGVDCEMCLTSYGSELTRISVVNENHEVIYEKLVLPYNKIFNYLTQYSGITKPMLEGVTTRLQDVQNDLRELLPADAILVGQSLNSDLHALKMMHPYIIDTSVIFNISGERSRKSKLKVLAQEFLHEKIQESRQGHCSVEDSLASLKLAQLKLKNTVDYGDAVLVGRKKMEIVKERKMKESPAYTTTIFNHMLEQKKSSVIVGCEDIIGDYHDYLNRANGSLSAHSFAKKSKTKKVQLKTMDNQDDVIKIVCGSSKEHNFTLAHLKVEADSDSERCECQMNEVDKWIADIHDSVAVNSLVVVVLSGTVGGNGVALINLKRGGTVSTK